MAIIVVLWTLGYTFAKLFQCGSHSFERRPFYDFDYSSAVCVDTFMLGYSFAITDFITDCLIAFIPIPLVSSKRKGPEQTPMLIRNRFGGFNYRFASV